MEPHAPDKVLAPAALVDIAHQRSSAQQDNLPSSLTDTEVYTRQREAAGKTTNQVQSPFQATASALKKRSSAPIALLVHAALKAAQRGEVHILRGAFAGAERSLAPLTVQRLLLPATACDVSQILTFQDTSHICGRKVQNMSNKGLKVPKHGSASINAYNNNLMPPCKNLTNKG